MAACHSVSLAEKPSAIVAVPQFTAPKKVVKPGDTIDSFAVGGQQRTVFLHVPKSYSAKKPSSAVIAFHGYGGNGKQLADGSGLSALAEQQGFIAVYPDGLDRRWSVGGDQDVKFVRALLDRLQQQYGADPRRIYATGISNGGFLVQRLACEIPTRVRAFASVVATVPDGLQQACQSNAPVSMLMMNGTDDRKVPWNGGTLGYGSILSVPDSIRFWQQKNGCPAQPKTQNVNARVQIDRYVGCRNGAEVELVTLKGAGHVFPRGGGGANSLIDGSREIWQFFQRQS